MKTKSVLFWMCACLIAVGAFAIAEQAEEPDSEDAAVRTPARPARPVPGRSPAREQADRPPRPTVPADREDAMRAAMARRMEVHRQEIAKLQEILEIAKGEDAEKTVEALEALIAEKNQQVQQQVEQAERRRQEMQERLQERLEQRREQRADPDQQPARPAPDERQRGRRRQPAE